MLSPGRLQACLDEICRRSLSSFIAKTFATVDPGATYLPNWHIDLIAEYLKAVEQGDIKRLIINMPPRALKSICISVAWPAWLLGHNPKRRILTASYSSNLSIKHSLDCRLAMQSMWYKRLFPDTLIAPDQNEKHKFVTTGRGCRIATSVGGTVTGEGGNFLILDDAISAGQAMNKAARDYANQWFDHTFASRLDDKKNGCIVVVMQRLHPDDLTAHLTGKGGWELLCLPAIAEEDSVYSMGGFHKLRKEGEPLHSEREDEALIEQAKVALGSQAYSAQYQQQPLPEEGSMIKRHWLLRYTTLPEGEMYITQSWDTAIKAASHHDASVCMTFASMEGQHYILDIQLMRVEYPALKRQVIAQAEQWKPHAVLIEDKASGQQLLQDIKLSADIPLIPIRPVKDKLTRFAAVTAMIEAGKLVLPKEAPWLAGFESEILYFPYGKHDDQIDALSQYLNWIRLNKATEYSVRVL